jgi:hypothetical protein
MALNNRWILLIAKHILKQPVLCVMLVLVSDWLEASAGYPLLAHTDGPASCFLHHQRCDSTFYREISMENIPQETVDRIIEYVARLEGRSQWTFDGWKHMTKFTRHPHYPHFASYATISRTWKKAVEQVNFAELTIDNEDFGSFQTIVTGKRRTFVKELSLTVSMPDCPDYVRYHDESDEEQQAHSKRFTLALCKLFAILKAWEDKGIQTPLRLVIPLENNCPPQNRLHDRKAEWPGRCRYDTSVIKLVQPFLLPTLSNVKYLDAYGYLARKLEPTMATTIAAALPNLVACKWELAQEDTWSLDEKIRNRTAFAHALKHMQLQPRATASIKFQNEKPVTQSDEGEHLVPPGMSYDPLSASLRMFSQSLTSMNLITCLDSTIFWPSDEEINAITPHWPHLKELYIEFSMVSPSGDWYFTGPDYDADNDVFNDPEYYHEYYRTDPDPDTFTPFINAFTKAVKNMPVLEYFKLTSNLEDGVNEGSFDITYYAPGMSAEREYEEDDDITVRRVIYELTYGAKWRPSYEVREALKGIGREKFGEDVIEEFLGCYDGSDSDGEE